ncbi:MAG: lysoplasmalogenase family protein [Defluviitaleaceae bacterium]|nr:lysoplasmalogenase family protein [Defluviitaleaceae bacterium]
MSEYMMQNISKMAVIGLCFLIALMGRKNAFSRNDSNWLVMALLITVIADFFLVLVVIPGLGVAIFCLAHICHAIRFSGERKPPWQLALAGLPGLVAIIATGDYLIAIAAIYAGLFAVSFSYAIRQFIRRQFPPINRRLILAGMILFLLCDISVAIFNARLLFEGANPEIMAFAQSAIWLFYAPAMVLLAISGYNFTKSTK